MVLKQIDTIWISICSLLNGIPRTQCKPYILYTDKLRNSLLMRILRDLNNKCLTHFMYFFIPNIVEAKFCTFYQKTQLLLNQILVIVIAI